MGQQTEKIGIKNENLTMYISSSYAFMKLKMFRTALSVAYFTMQK